MHSKGNKSPGLYFHSGIITREFTLRANRAANDPLITFARLYAGEMIIFRHHDRIRTPDSFHEEPFPAPPDGRAVRSPSEQSRMIREGEGLISAAWCGARGAFRQLRNLRRYTAAIVTIGGPR